MVLLLLQQFRFVTKWRESTEDLLLQRNSLWRINIFLALITDSESGNPQRSARRHVLDYHKIGQEVVNLLDNAHDQGENIDLPYVNNFDDLEIDDLLNQAEKSDGIQESFPGVLFGLIYLRFDFSEREADTVLRLLKLNLDFSSMKSVTDVLKMVGVAAITERAACRECCEEGTVLDGELSCTNPDCTETEVEKYITGNLAQQIRVICEGERLYHFRRGLFRADRRISDITDGKAYVEAQESLRMRLDIDDEDILLLLVANTDGVAIFESSPQSLWPVFLTISELSQDRRFREDKIVTYGLWQGLGKPPLECMMKNLQDEIDIINQDGLFVDTLAGRKRFYVHIPSIPSDLPARAYLLNMVGFNAEYGCAVCEIKGEVIAKGSGHCRHFATNENSAGRSDNSMRFNFERGTKDNPKKGFFGPPRITNLKNFNYGTGVLIDAMHGCCLGVAKKHVSLLFDGTQRYLTSDERLTARARYREFFPPPTFNRNPVEINASQWKASDFRNGISHYSVPCLTGLLEPKYLRHWILFVDAYAVLNGTDIRTRELDRAGDQLRQFCLEWQTLFELNEFGINIHGLTHLQGMVDNWGPLFCYDLFAFESKNGWLTRHSHATHDATRSLMKLLIGSQVLKRKSESVILPNELLLLKRIQGKRLRDGLRGPNFMSWSAAQSVPVNESGLTAAHPCLAHSLKRLNTACVGKVAVWTNRYRRPRRTMAQFFLMSDTRNKQQIFISVKELIFCTTCCFLHLVASHMKPEFLEPNRIFLVESDAGNVLINSQHVELQECVTSFFNGNLEVSLVPRSLYVD